MATNHASSGEVIDLRPLGAPLDDAQSTTLLRDEQLKVMRLVMPTGKELHDHAVDGPITMQCLEGEIGYGTWQLQDDACRRPHVPRQPKCRTRCAQPKTPQYW